MWYLHVEYQGCCIFNHAMHYSSCVSILLYVLIFVTEINKLPFGLFCRQSGGYLTSVNVGRLGKEQKKENPQPLRVFQVPLLIC